MKFILGFVLVLFYSSVFGQEVRDSIAVDDYQPVRAYFVEGAISVLAPQGNFNRQMDDVPIGLSFSALAQISPGQPFFVGVETYYAYVDDLSNTWFGFFDNGDPAEYQGTVTSNIIGVNAMYRYYLPVSIWKLEPYVEGAFGLKWLFTYESTTSFFDGFEEASTGEFVTSDVSLTYGGAVGLQLLLGGRTYLNMKTSYLPGNSAAYEVRSAGVVPSTFPIEAFERKQSATDVVKFDLGITYVF